MVNFKLQPRPQRRIGTPAVNKGTLQFKAQVGVRQFMIDIA